MSLSVGTGVSSVVMRARWVEGGDADSSSPRLHAKQEQTAQSCRTVRGKFIMYSGEFDERIEDALFSRA